MCSNVVLPALSSPRNTSFPDLFMKPLSVVEVLVHCVARDEDKGGKTEREERTWIHLLPTSRIVLTKGL